LTALSPAERGFVLGAARAGAGAEEAARRLDEPACGRCRSAGRALAAGGEAARLAALDEVAAELRAPLPAGLERVHPGWIRRALEDESSVVVRAIAARLPVGAREVATEILAGRDEDPDQPPPAFRAGALDALVRAIFSGISPMTGAPENPGALIEELERRGAMALGRSLAGAPRAVVARAAVGIGEPWARAVVDAASEAIAPGERAAARALVAAVTPAEVARLGAARAIGVRATAAQLAGADEAERLAAAQRLPPALGQALLAALAGGGRPAEDD
jgi:hypothetical protein